MWAFHANSKSALHVASSLSGQRLDCVCCLGSLDNLSFHEIWRMEFGCGTACGEVGFLCEQKIREHEIDNVLISQSESSSRGDN